MNHVGRVTAEERQPQSLGRLGHGDRCGTGAAEKWLPRPMIRTIRKTRQTVLFDRKTCSTGGFTLIEIMACLALLGIVVGLALPIHLDAVERAKAVEATTTLAEVVRLEHLYYADTGTYTSDFQVLGFDLSSPLQYTQLF